MLKFGTGGWRAFIGEDFTRENVMIMTQALANIIVADGKQKEGVVIGFDRRFLSDKASKWCAEVLAGNGIKVYYMKRISPTPLTMFAVKLLNTYFGVEITASHNPADYNGMKIFAGPEITVGRKYTKEMQADTDVINPSEIKILEFNEAIEDGIVEHFDCINEYIDEILAMIDVKSIRDGHLKILLDPMFGVSRTALQTILVTARCDLDIINDRHDTLFGGKLPAPTSKTLKRLSELVVDGEYDIGIGTDGDADRLGIIDEKGGFIHPNNILTILYYYLLKYKGWKGAAVKNICTTSMLNRVAEHFGEECFEVPVGFKNVSMKMKECDALIGGESSGGLTIRGHIDGKDGIFAGSILVELIAVAKKPLTELLQEIYDLVGKLYPEEDDFKFSKEKKDELQDLLFVQKKLPDFGRGIKEISYLDGVKIFFDDGGWLVCRFSGTENLLRINDEMNSQEDAEEAFEIMKKFLGI
jgi:phosphomannomutase